EREERVTRQHLLAVGKEPLVQLTLLAGGRMQVVPDIGAAGRRAQPRDPQLGAEGVGNLLEGVELRDVLAGDDYRDLESLEAGRGQVAHRGQRRLERPGPS